jgi:ABC-type multidrug transport system fused ATPase/permease subunit
VEKKEQRILNRAEKVGLKLVQKNGRVPTRDKLLQTKIQILPVSVRWLMFFGSGISGLLAWYFFGNSMVTAGSISAVVSFFLLLFSIFGIRQTLEKIADQMSYDIIDGVFELIGGAVGSVLD